MRWSADEMISRSLLGAFLLLCLTSIWSNRLLASFSPVYGSIPTHHYAGLLDIESLTAANILTFAPLDFDFLAPPVLLHICATPLLLKYILSPWSSKLGPIYGSLLSQLITSLPPHLLSCHRFLQVSSRYYNVISSRWTRSENHNSRMVRFIRVCLLAGLYRLSQRFAAWVVAYCAPFVLDGYGYESKTKTSYSTGLQGLAILYVAVLAMSVSRRQLSFAMALCIISVFAYGGFSARNHRQTVNARLRPYGYTVLDSTISQTGYISVLENFNDRFRVLRNDHSLLGGTWMPNPERGIYQPESVYPVFNILEAVRLMEGNATASQSRKTALVIGLGAGTAPSALAAHGIETTAVEIDTAVIEFAKTYFEAHKDVVNINEDAASFIAQARLEKRTYDYIIHDVFSGGAEPLELFTVEFLKGLRDTLKTNGFVAINYAGDLAQPSTLATLQIIIDVFNQCRIFRDSEQPRNPGDRDIVNIVAFCGNGKEKWSFREVVEADFLGSEARRQCLPPRHEIDRAALGKLLEFVDVMKIGRKRDLGKYRLNSALEHWKIMREVLPSAVWENY